MKDTATALAEATIAFLDKHVHKLREVLTTATHRGDMPSGCEAVIEDLHQLEALAGAHERTQIKQQDSIMLRVADLIPGAFAHTDLSCPPFITVDLPSGEIVNIANYTDTWGANVSANQEALGDGDVSRTITTDIPYDSTDAELIAATFTGHIQRGENERHEQETMRKDTDAMLLKIAEQQDGSDDNAL